jgi:hypothetical protein
LGTVPEVALADQAKVGGLSRTPQVLTGPRRLSRPFLERGSPINTDNDAKIRRWEQYIEETRKEAKLLSPEGQQELQTVIQSYEKLIAMARDQATKPKG